MLKIMGKKIFTIFCTENVYLNLWPERYILYVQEDNRGKINETVHDRAERSSSECRALDWGLNGC